MLTGLTQGQRDNFQVMKAVANQTQVGPEERELRKRQLIRRIKDSPEAYKKLTDWGISLPDECVIVQGRVLDPQSLLFGGGTEQVVSGDQGIERAVRTHQMFKAVDLHNWTLIHHGDTNINTLCRVLERCHQKLGMAVSRPKNVIQLPNDRTESYIRAIRDVIRNDCQQQLIMTIVPSKREDR